MPAPTKGPRLGGSPAHQKAILSNLATNLFEHGAITTTEAKARRLRPFAEKLISKAKRGDLHNRRQVLSVVRDKSVVHLLFTEIGPRYADRPGGYTRITKLGPRKGDNAPMAVIELVEADFTPKSRATKKATASKGASSAPVAEDAPQPTDEADVTDDASTETADDVSTDEAAEVEADGTDDDADVAETDATDEVAADASDAAEVPAAEAEEAAAAEQPADSADDEPAEATPETDGNPEAK